MSMNVPAALHAGACFLHPCPAHFGYELGARQPSYRRLQSGHEVFSLMAVLPCWREQVTQGTLHMGLSPRQ